MADHLPKNIRLTMEKLKGGATEKQRRLIDKLDYELTSMVPADQGGAMRVESMVASKTKNPVVTFIWGQNKGELSPIEARQYALQIIEASEAAVQDATLYRVLVEGPLAGQPDAEAGAFVLINQVRNNRRAFEQEP